jgi:hypothetical protein
LFVRGGHATLRSGDVRATLEELGRYTDWNGRRRLLERCWKEFERLRGFAQ